MKWYTIVSTVGWLCLIIFFINQSMTDYSAGVLDYKGFIPTLYSVFLPIIWLTCEFIWIGASIESCIDRKKEVKK